MGDVYGTSSLSIQSRTGIDGALLSTSGGPGLVDLGFNTGASQQNIRYETRVGSVIGGGNTAEFQIGPAGAPNLVVGSSTTSIVGLG